MAKIENTKKSVLDARRQAGSQSANRSKASEKKKAKAGLVLPETVKIKKDASGKVTATKHGKDFEGPISGSAVMRANRRRDAMAMQSGVMQGGKIIKGGATARTLANNYKGKKAK